MKELELLIWSNKKNHPKSKYEWRAMTCSLVITCGRAYKTAASAKSAATKTLRSHGLRYSKCTIME